MVLKSETLILSQNYDSDIPRQFLNSFKTSTNISIFWSSTPSMVSSWKQNMEIVVQ